MSIMTVWLVGMAIAIVARCVYLEFRHDKQKRLLAQQRGWIVEYYYTLRQKDLPTDFQIWALELEDDEYENRDKDVH